MVLANALLIVPEGENDLPAGTPARAIVLNDPQHQAEPPF